MEESHWRQSEEEADSGLMLRTSADTASMHAAARPKAGARCRGNREPGEVQGTVVGNESCVLCVVTTKPQVRSAGNGSRSLGLVAGTWAKSEVASGRGWARGRHCLGMGRIMQREHCFKQFIHASMEGPTPQQGGCTRGSGALLRRMAYLCGREEAQGFMQVDPQNWCKKCFEKGCTGQAVRPRAVFI